MDPDGLVLGGLEGHLLFLVGLRSGFSKPQMLRWTATILPPVRTLTSTPPLEVEITRLTEIDYHHDDIEVASWEGPWTFRFSI